MQVISEHRLTASRGGNVADRHIRHLGGGKRTQRSNAGVEKGAISEWDIPVSEREPFGEVWG